MRFDCGLTGKQNRWFSRNPEFLRRASHSVNPTVCESLNSDAEPTTLTADSHTVCYPITVVLVCVTQICMHTRTRTTLTDNKVLSRHYSYTHNAINAAD
jgi:hypothetical protein